MEFAIAIQKNSSATRYSIVLAVLVVSIISKHTPKHHRIPAEVLLNNSEVLSRRGPIEYSFHFIGIGNGSRGFKNTNVNRPF